MNVAATRAAGALFDPSCYFLPAEIGDPMAESAERRDEFVPDAVIPHRNLPPLRYRDLPEPVPWRKMVGPSIILAGLALGSGEFILWPYIVYRSGFVFFWACMLGVFTQYFLNMEIERWTLATGESAITGFVRLWRPWAILMLVLNIVPFAWPGWATGAAQIASWFVYGPVETVGESGLVVIGAKHVPLFGIGILVLSGIILTAGPVVYNTVEKVQMVLVGLILVLVLILAAAVVRWDAVCAMARGILNIGGMPDLDATGISLMSLLGALAFAGAGGTVNLGQSNYVKDKGYGMGRYIGRITSPVTGLKEPISEIGYHFHHTPENMRRWQGWWRAANIEHAVSFLATCVLCLCLMALIAYSLCYDAQGHLNDEIARYADGMNFVWGEAAALSHHPLGRVLRPAFLLMGFAILLTTAFGLLDAVSRISTDIVKVNLLRDSEFFTQSRLYYFFLWAEIALGSAILAIPMIVPAGVKFGEPLFLLKTSAAMNGGVMFLYSLILLYLNSKILPRSISINWTRFVAIVWSAAFFGYFTIQSLRLDVGPYFKSAARSLWERLF